MACLGFDCSLYYFHQYGAFFERTASAPLVESQQVASHADRKFLSMSLELKLT